MAKTSTSWKKGQHGGSKGGPIAWKWSDIVREAANQEIEGKPKRMIAAEILLEKAMSGDVQAIKEMGDRIDGKPQQAIDHTSDGEPLTLITKSPKNDL